MPEYLSPSPLPLRISNFVALLCILMGAILIGSATFVFVMKSLLHLDSADTIRILDTLESVPNARNFLILAQGITSLISFILIPLIVIFIVWPELKEKIFARNLNAPMLLIIACLLTFASIPVIAYLSEWNKSVLHLPEGYKNIEQWMINSEKEAERLTYLLAYYKTTFEFWTGLLVIALLPAIGEELLFRGVVQNTLSKIFLNPHVAIIATGFLFSFIHFQFFGFIPRMLLGILFGYVYYWSGNLFFPIIMHFANNAITYLALNLYKNKTISVNLDSTTQLPFSLFLGAMALCILLLIQFHKLSKQPING